MRKKRKKVSFGDMLMDIIIWSILILLAVVCLYPVWYVFVASFSNSTDLVRDPGILLWPKEFNTGAYRLVFRNPLLLNSLKNSVFILVVSLPLNITLTLMCGYFMACEGMIFKKAIMLVLLLSMFISPGIIPNYLNIRSLGLNNSLWSLILPGFMTYYYAILCKAAIQNVPDGLRESAYIDGANDFQIIWKVILPLIKPTIAVILLYYGVNHWNAWFDATIYIRTNDKMPVQNILRSVLLANESLGGGGGEAGDSYNAYAESIKYAAIMVTTVPVLCIYPFLQKYFAKGAMIGAVKG